MFFFIKVKENFFYSCMKSYFYTDNFKNVRLFARNKLFISLYYTYLSGVHILISVTYCVKIKAMKSKMKKI
jgi:hypothetical protein